MFVYIYLNQVQSSMCGGRQAPALRVFRIDSAKQNHFLSAKYSSALDAMISTVSERVFAPEKYAEASS